MQNVSMYISVQFSSVTQSCPTLCNTMNMYMYIYMCINLILENEEYLAICISTGELWEYCATWNKPDREREIPYGLIYMWRQKDQPHRNRDKSGTYQGLQEIGKCWSKGMQFIIWWINSGDLIYSIMIIVKILYKNWNLLKE